MFRGGLPQLSVLLRVDIRLSGLVPPQCAMRIHVQSRFPRL